ncbi:hypothetical protein [Actinoplanes sp. URMC 104]|uniref:hypothetical protein n=1 Tax=Actinoplanes sp. URMC 104 TaxID=3423409 RepID=UPI003F1C1472
MSTEQPNGAPRRYRIEPDPAWDWYEEEDGGVLAVELSWVPDALAGRPPEVVAGPELVAVMADAGLTGYVTGPARGYYVQSAFGVQPSDTAPPLVRLTVGDDQTADFSFLASQGLTVSERALALLQEHCRNLTVMPPRN